MTFLEAINAQIAIKIRELDALRAEREALSPSPQDEIKLRDDQISRLLKIMGDETKRRNALIQEAEYLRTALRHISLAAQSSMGTKEECGSIARAALARKEVNDD